MANEPVRTYEGGWNPPDPTQLPEWRMEQIADLEDPRSRAALGSSLETGTTAIAPILGGHARKAITLCEEEMHRLRNADLFYVTADMTALALNGAQTTPLGPVDPARIPSERGFMVFAEPITSYRIPHEVMRQTPMHELLDEDIHVPIVACSWGPMDPAPHGAPMWERPDNSIEIGDALGVKTRPREKVLRAPGTWVTLFTYSGSTYDGLDRDKPIGYHPQDGTPFTPRQMMEVLGRTAPLAWDGEGFLAHGREWGDSDHVMAQPYVGRALNVVYTAWLMMTDPRAKKLVEQATQPRPRQGRKRDARAGVAASSDVRIVKVHSRIRPSRAAVEQDAAASDGRKAPQWSCRWTVRMHRRMQWYPSREDWSEIVIYPHVKGPADKPLRLRENVNVWDEMPGKGGED